MKRISSRERSYALIFILALGFGAWNYRHLFSSASEDSGWASGRGSAAVPAASQGAEQNSAAKLAAQVSRDSLPDWRDDPFNRPWRSAAAVSQPAAFNRSALRLSAIVVRPNLRYAVINGAIVREGQDVAGRRVTHIEATRVLVDDNGVEVTLSL